MPEPEPFSLERAWLRVLKPSPHAAWLRDNSTPVEFADGALRVAVRQPMWREQVRDRLGPLAFPEHFPGFRRLEVIVATEGGRTGREVREAREESSRADAVATAERCPILRRVCELFDAELERVEPVAVGPRDSDESVEEASDE